MSTKDLARIDGLEFGLFMEVMQNIGSEMDLGGMICRLRVWSS